MVKELKGIIRKPDRPVSIDDMNAAAGPREGSTDASKAIAADDDTELQAWLDMPAVGSEFGAVPPQLLQARVVFDPARNVFVGTIIESGATIDVPDILDLADWLFAAGVRHGHVSMPDWREGDIAPCAGDKIALNHRLNQLGQAPAT